MYGTKSSSIIVAVLLAIAIKLVCSVGQNWPNAPSTRPGAYCQNIPAQWPLNIENLNGIWNLSYYYETREYFPERPEPNCANMKISSVQESDSTILKLEVSRTTDGKTYKTWKKTALVTHPTISPGKWILKESSGLFAFAGPSPSSLTVLAVWPKTFINYPDVQSFLFLSCSMTGPTYDALDTHTDVGIVNRNNEISLEALDYFTTILNQYSPLRLPAIGYAARHGPLIESVRRDNC